MSADIHLFQPGLTFQKNHIARSQDAKKIPFSVCICATYKRIYVFVHQPGRVFTRQFQTT